MLRIVGIAVAVVGLMMMVIAAGAYPVSPLWALFVGGIGATLLGVGGIAQFNVPGGAVVGGAGFVMMVIASLAPHLP